MGNSWIPQAPRDYNRMFRASVESLPSVIKQKQLVRPTMWLSQIARGVAELGKGATRLQMRAYPGVGDMVGLERWRPVTSRTQRMAQSQETMEDVNAYQPYLVRSGMDETEYSALKTERRTEAFAINEITLDWEFAQQLENQVNFLSDIVNSVWNNAGREMTLKFAGDNTNLNVFSTAPIGQQHFEYNPYYVDSDGDHIITVPAGVKISTINWTGLRGWRRRVELRAPSGAVGRAGNRPVFAMMLDMDDFDDMVERNSELRQDYRYYRPELNIEGFGSVETFKGIALTNEEMQVRASVKRIAADGTMYLKVEVPYAEEAATLGVKPVVREDYENAPYALAIPVLRDTFSWEIMPTGPASIAGMNFGVTPSNQGEFAFINHANNTDNLLGEWGFFFGRFNAFAKDGENAEEASALLYKRCIRPEAYDCGYGGDNVVAVGANVSLAVDAASADIDTTNNIITLTLASVLPGEEGSLCNVVDDDGAADEGIIADASAAPTYVIALKTAPQAYGKYTAAGAAYVESLEDIG